VEIVPCDTLDGGIYCVDEISRGTTKDCFYIM
jgi:hypothetical protein